MTYYGPRELAASFRQVRANTILIANEIPEEKYGFRASPETRTIGQTLVHIAVASSFQTHVHTNRIDDLGRVNFMELVGPMMAEEAKPRDKAAIVALLEAEGEKFASYLEGLSEAFLAEPVKSPAGVEPASKSRFEMLLSAKEHEMHHRGQLMLLQRMLGLTPHLTRRMQERAARRMQEAAQ
jgi:uncharacterized damage-inducible protein DinB